jgi:hypothetical protein
MDISWNATAALLAILIAPSNWQSQKTVLKLNKLADRFVDQQLQYDPTLSYSTSQSAVAWLIQRKLLLVRKEAMTATPVYSVESPWQR